MLHSDPRVTKNSTFPSDVPLKLPQHSSLKKEDQHFLLFIPWSESYLQYVPAEYREFFSEILPYLSARTTDVHTACCMQYLDEYIHKSQALGRAVNRDVVAYALMLHDSGWSQMSEEEIAQSLGVKGLALNASALGPKEKHALLSEQIAREILTEKQVILKLSDKEIKLICKAILYHDRPEEVAGATNPLPEEVRLLVDLDHLWSFTHLNFWQDVLRKGVEPHEYYTNLLQDLPSYFVTDIGKEKARTLLQDRHSEVLSFSQ